MTTAPSASPKSTLFIVFLVVFIDLLGFGIVLPLMPIYADDFMSGYSKGEQDAMIALLFGSFSLMQFLFSPVWGRLSDRVGRKPMILLGLGGSVVFYALFAYASGLPSSQSTLALVLLLVSRIGAGIAGSSVSTAAAIIADCTTPEKRSHGMALIGVSFGIGFTFGPLLAYVSLISFAEAKWAPGAVASGLSLLAMLLAIRKLPETLKPGGDSSRVHFFSLKRTLNVLKMPALGPLILIYFLAITAFANFEATLARFTKYSFHFGAKENCFVFAGIGFVLMVAQGGFYRRFAKKMSELALMKAGVAMMFMGLGGLGIVAYFLYMASAPYDDKSQFDASGFQNLFYLCSAVAVFGFAFLNPSVTALVSRRADPTRQGEILGVNQSFSALGRIAGPVLGSMVFNLHDSHTMPFAVAGVLLLVVVVLLNAAAKGGNEAKS